MNNTRVKVKLNKLLSFLQQELMILNTRFFVKPDGLKKIKVLSSFLKIVF